MSGTGTVRLEVSPAFGWWSRDRKGSWGVWWRWGAPVRGFGGPLFGKSSLFWAPANGYAMRVNANLETRETADQPARRIILLPFLWSFEKIWMELR
jgi:hypothetical protein